MSKSFLLNSFTASYAASDKTAVCSTVYRGGVRQIAIRRMIK